MLENKMVLDDQWLEYEPSIYEDENYLEYLDHKWQEENGY